MKLALLSLFSVQGFRPPGPTTYSRGCRDFPATRAVPRFWRDLSARFVSAEENLKLDRLSDGFVSARKTPFPRSRDFNSKRRGSNLELGQGSGATRSIRRLSPRGAQCSCHTERLSGAIMSHSCTVKRVASYPAGQAKQSQHPSSRGPRQRQQK